MEVGVFGVGRELVFKEGRHEIECTRVLVHPMDCTGKREASNEDTQVEYK